MAESAIAVPSSCVVTFILASRVLDFASSLSLIHI